MAVSRKKKVRRGRPRILGPSTPTNLSVEPSLPPAPVDETPQVTAPEPSTMPPMVLPESINGRWQSRPPVGHPDRGWWLPDDSVVRTQALQIIAMRINGMDDAEIAKLLNISINSISPYVYRATKNGWLDISYNPKERVQLQTMHKVVQRLEEALDSKAVLNTGMKEQTHVALKIAEGTLFKQFDQQAPQQAHQTVVAVQVVMPDGPIQTIREETTGGTPAYIDAD